MPTPAQSLAVLQGGLAPTAGSTASLVALREALDEGNCGLYRPQHRTHLTVSALIQHIDTGMFAAMWHPKAQCWRQPGGHLDPADDTILAAVQREIAEEVGASGVSWSQTFWLRTFDIANNERCGQHIDFAIGGRTPSERLTSPEGHQVRWQSAGEGEHLGSWTTADIAAFHQTTH